MAAPGIPLPGRAGGCTVPQNSAVPGAVYLLGRSGGISRRRGRSAAAAVSRRWCRRAGLISRWRRSRGRVRRGRCRGRRIGRAWRGRLLLRAGCQGQCAQAQYEKAAIHKITSLYVVGKSRRGSFTVPGGTQRTVASGVPLQNGTRGRAATPQAGELTSWRRRAFSSWPGLSDGTCRTSPDKSCRDGSCYHLYP